MFAWQREMPAGDGEENTLTGCRAGVPGGVNKYHKKPSEEIYGKQDKEQKDKKSDCTDG